MDSVGNLLLKEDRGVTSFVRSICQGLDSQRVVGFTIWEFPKIRGTLFWGPCYRDPTIGALY